MKNFYLPSKEADRVTWLNTFSSRIGGYAATFGISTTEVTAILAMAVIYSYFINLIDASKKFTKALTSFKNILSIAKNGTPLPKVPVFSDGTIPPLTEAGIFTFIAGIVARIKSNTANYNETVGKDLGIIGAETVFIPADYKANGAGKTMPGYVAISFEKIHLDGMDIFSYPVGDDSKVFEKIGTCSFSPFHDARPLAVAGVPEKRNYQTRGVIHDAEIGFFSDIFSVTFAG